MREDEWLDCLIGRLDWIAVDPAFRDQGVGFQLLSAVEEWFRIKQVDGRHLHVSAHNEAALALYQKFDYQIVDHRMLGKSTDF